MASAKREIAMVFQSYALYPHMDVASNMAFGLKFAKTPKPGIEARAAAAASILQLEPVLKPRPREISGGQRQHVAIGSSAMNFLSATVVEPPACKVEDTVTFGCRLDLLSLISAGGRGFSLMPRASGQTVIAAVRGDAHLNTVGLNPNHLHVFDAAGRALR